MGRSRDHGGGGGGGGSPRDASSSSSSSDFEFTVSLSPSSKRLSSQLCPADELFYKGQLLPLQLSPRISMVRTLLLSSSSTSSSSDTATSSSRDSNGSTSSSRDSNGSTSSSFSADLLLLPTDSDSSRPSSVTEEEYSKLSSFPSTAKRPKYYFSSFATRFSSVFLHRGGSKKDSSAPLDLDAKKPNSAKEVIKKCVKKVKPFYDKLKQSNIQSSPPPLPHNNNTTTKKTFSFSIRKEKLTPTSATTTKKHDDDDGGVLRHRRGVYIHSNSFSGNLKFPRKKMAAASCPSSMRSSPSHSGLLCIGGGGSGGFPDLLPPVASSPPSASSMEELHSAIQGAIAHCKSSMIQGTHKKSPPPASNGDEEVHAS
ncbi:probable membrane-associated kinase regulator 1 [Typha angustifolia]|uniref:probable membrane-associated kinase regulator 1 n=1 Tax=Typha angustifolia TaxID=59011 RepID=UPI003C2B7BC3